MYSEIELSDEQLKNVTGAYGHDNNSGHQHGGEHGWNDRDEHRRRRHHHGHWGWWNHHRNWYWDD